MTTDVLPTASPRRSRARVTRLLRARRGAVAVVVVLTALASAASLAGPALIGAVVNVAVDTVSIDTVASTGERRSELMVIGVSYALLAVAGGLLSYLAAVRAAIIGESSLAEIRTEVFEHALTIDTTIIEQGGTGDLVARLTGDVDALARAVRETVPVVLFAIAQLIVGVAALVLVDVRLALVAIAAGSPIAALGVWWYVRHAPRRYRKERERLAALSGLLLQLYRGRSTVLAHRADEALRARAVHAGGEVVAAEMWTTAARNRLRPSINLALGASLVGVVIAGSTFVDDGAMSLGAVTAAALYVVRLFGPIGVLMEELDEIQQATAAMARLVGVTEVPAEHVVAEPAARQRTDRRPAPGIRVRDVDFSYDADAPVLHEINIEIDGGEQVVIVGPSGAGKSTLAKLLAGVHRADRGLVTVGGRAVHEGDVSTTVALMTQEVHVFRRSVVDNVRLGRPDADRAAVSASVDLVGAGQWVARLPDGIDTIVGDGAYELTAPQAQQIALARVVCADPAVIVLDEATADLDPFAAAETERHLAASFDGRTVVTIAHRLDVAARADRVVVMEAGRITEIGPHSERLAAGGTYAQLWERWSSAR